MNKYLGANLSGVWDRFYCIVRCTHYIQDTTSVKCNNYVIGNDSFAFDSIVYVLGDVQITVLVQYSIFSEQEKMAFIVSRRRGCVALFWQYTSTVLRISDHRLLVQLHYSIVLSRVENHH